MSDWQSIPHGDSPAWADEDGAIATGEAAGGTTLFLIHDETGDAAEVTSLARSISGATTMLSLVDEVAPELRTVEGIALRLVRRIVAAQPAGPYRIAGWALGGTVAWEVAALLLGRDARVDFLGVIHRSGDGPEETSASDFDTDGELVLQLRRAVRRYVPPPLPLTVHLFTTDAAEDAGPWRAWGAAEPKATIRTIRVDADAELAEAVDGEIRRAGESKETGCEERHSPVFPLRFKGSGAPVFCIPGAGASVVTLTELAAALDPGSPVYGLEPRGMDGMSLPHTTVEAAAELYLSQLGEAAGAGPIHLVGHSFGGWVALEMALRLHAEGRPVASLSVIDSSVPDADGATIRECDGEEAFLRFVEVVELTAERSLEIAPAQVRAMDAPARLRLLHERMVRCGLVPARSAPAMLAGPFRVFSACLRTTWRPRAAYPHPARLVLLRDPRLDAEADRLQMAQVARAWRAWLPHAQVSLGPGNHMTALKRPHVEQLASLLPLGT